MIDSHVHLNRSEFDEDRAAVLERAEQAGVRGFLNVGYDPDTSTESIALAESNPRILATVGVHPHDAALLADADGKPSRDCERILADMEAQSNHPRVVAIGEIGLDYFRDLSPRAAQDTAFARQIELAEQVGLPVVLHVRDAWPETLAVIDRVGAPSNGGVLHSFSGGLTEVEWARERGFLLGIGGPVTYKKSHLPELVATAGLDMLLLETDAPWLPPVPFRGKRNESCYLEHTCGRIAEALGTTSEEVANRTTTNFARLFFKGTFSE